MPKRQAIVPRRYFSAAGVLALLALLGCTDSPKTQRKISSVSQSREELFENVVGTLNNLPRYVNTEVRPPKLLLDSTSSKNGKMVLAVVTTHPSQPEGPINYLRVVTRNSRFKHLQVQPGDQIRFYAQTDEFGKKGSLDLTVAEVVDENSLLIAGSLTAPANTPEPIEVWRDGDDRIQLVVRRIQRYGKDKRGGIGWEPSADEAGLQQMLDLLNQWVRAQKPDDTWKLEPAIESLPQKLQMHVDPQELAALEFDPYDARLLQEAVWLRDIANWVRQGALSDLDAGTKLFDWTVRNIQLKSADDPGALPQRPWQTLMYGQGTAEQRAWVFAMLARQVGLDVVMLAYPDPAKSGKLRPWVPALVSGGQLYLFEPRLGLPIPGPEGKGVATLAEVLADPALLARLNVDAEHPYPVKPEDLKDLVAWVEASPVTLSRRMQLIESKLAGDSRVTLTAHLDEVKEALKPIKSITKVAIWPLAYQTIADQLALGPNERAVAGGEFIVYALRPKLWRARVRHFQGKFDGTDGAIADYRGVRPSDADIANARVQPIEKALIKQGKVYASYWLGLLTFDQGEYQVAIDYFANRTLAATPDGPWTHGARYNLARCYEALGELDKAIELYEQDPTSPQADGNFLRAKWLKEKTQQPKPEQATPVAP